MSSTRAVFFDLETGGVEPGRPDIQLAAVAFGAGWDETGAFEAKIAFDEADAADDALALNHYDREAWLREARPEKEVVRMFGAFLNRHRALTMRSKRTGRPYTVAMLVGHNAADFDGPRLQAMFKRHDEFLPADPRVRCTVQRALWWFDESGVAPPADYRLATLCSYFGVPVAERATHDALADVRLAAALARAMRSTAPTFGRS